MLEQSGRAIITGSGLTDAAQKVVAAAKGAAVNRVDRSSRLRVQDQGHAERIHRRSSRPTDDWMIAYCPEIPGAKRPRTDQGRGHREPLAGNRPHPRRPSRGRG